MPGVQSIQRAFRLLRLLGTGPQGVTELAEKSLLPKSTTARLLGALEDEGAVERVDGGTNYCLGSGLADLASGVLPGRNLVAVARPFLVELSDLTGETAGISVLSDDSVYYLDHVSADASVQARDWTGEYAPLHAVPSGMVILATA
ncbi:MAG: helix-turn-helix domain-containing protein, partial [Acidimicrobiales bacterium]|nr:helix-turn-helix domain-containing protein [Acidimicrobiales bacterium]